MAEGKYGRHIIPAPIMQSVMFPQIKAPQINIFGGEHLGGINFTMNWSYLTEPFVMVDKAHSHDFDQVICFIGGDPTNIREFGGVVEMYFGEEQEKHVITSPSYICVPRGLIHGPLIIKKIDKPIVYMDFPLTARYVKKDAPEKK
ncbi:MAG: hypothetical protein N2506_02535 [Dehalococcoidales bacterium]|nr:hypothetical protein [Dehalococcoidales bacterium]